MEEAPGNRGYLLGSARQAMPAGPEEESPPLPVGSGRLEGLAPLQGRARVPVRRRQRQGGPQKIGGPPGYRPKRREWHPFSKGSPAPRHPAPPSHHSVPPFSEQTSRRDENHISGLQENIMRLLRIFYDLFDIDGNDPLSSPVLPYDDSPGGLGELTESPGSGHGL